MHRLFVWWPSTLGGLRRRGHWPTALLGLHLLGATPNAWAQPGPPTVPSTAAATPTATLLRPAAVFDGQDRHEGWAVLVENDKITAVGPAAQVTAPAGARTLDLPGLTLLPGLIEGHSHLLLHPYNETSWNDQVLLESQALRVARATAHAQRTLLAGFTTTRDLGTEGAGYADVGLKQAIDQGIIPGPRLLVATRALVATGSYGPKLSVDEDVPQGASSWARGPTLSKCTPTTAGAPRAPLSPRFRRTS